MRRLSLVMLCALIALVFSVGLPAHKAEAQTGYASWYSMPGAYTASGQLMMASTWGAAHRSLPFGTELTVCYAGGGCAYDVPVIDRGPYVYGRDLDVTAAVADQIGLTYAGVGLVSWWVEQLHFDLPLAHHGGLWVPSLEKVNFQGRLRRVQAEVGLSAVVGLQQLASRNTSAAATGQPSLGLALHPALRWTLDGVGVAIERRFIEAPEVSAKHAIAS